MTSWNNALQQASKQLEEAGLLRKLKVRQSPNSRSVLLNGKPYLAFTSNDYLGLSHHPTLIAAMKEGSERYGVGSGASSLISGHTQVHEELEDCLAQTQSNHIPDVKASLISTGTMANTAVITALASLESISIYSDALNHASIIDGIRLAKAMHPSKSTVYPHRDYEQLNQYLLNDAHPLKLIVTDSVFSMDGTIVDIKKLVKIAEYHQALLYIDDAHGFGVLGDKGHGSLEHFQINSPNVIYMGTLGKAVGMSGAFVAASSQWINWLIQKARPIIYSTAPPPNLAYGLLKSIELIKSDEGQRRRLQLQTLIAYWQENADFKSWKVIDSTTPIQAVIIGSNELVLDVSAQLAQSGIWVPAIRPPTVPVGTGRIRISFNANHQTSDLDFLIKTLHAIEKAL